MRKCAKQNFRLRSSLRLVFFRKDDELSSEHEMKEHGMRLSLQTRWEVEQHCKGHVVNHLQRVDTRCSDARTHCTEVL